LLSRAQGCLLGPLAGDALGSLVEFKTPEQIRRLHPEGVRELAGGTFHTIAGQPTDDSEMALILARSIIEPGCYDPRAARKPMCIGT
jgi:ADP-ribosylglycohydrolase